MANSFLWKHSGFWPWCPKISLVLRSEHVIFKTSVFLYMWEIFSCRFFDTAFILSPSSKHSNSNGTCGHGLDLSVLFHCVLGNCSSLIRLSAGFFFFLFPLLSPVILFHQLCFFLTFKNAISFFSSWFQFSYPPVFLRDLLYLLPMFLECQLKTGYCYLYMKACT